MQGNALDFDLAANRMNGFEGSSNDLFINRSIISKFWTIDAWKCFGFRSRRESNERIQKIVQRFIDRLIISKFWTIDAWKCFGFRSRRESRIRFEGSSDDLSIDR